MSLYWIFFSFIHFGLIAIIYKAVVQFHPNLTFRRGYLVLVSLFGLIFPFISFGNFQVPIQLNEITIGAIQSIPLVDVVLHSANREWFSVVYLVGFSFACLIIVLPYLRVWQMISKMPILENQSVKIRLNKNDIPTFSFWNQICLHENDVDKEVIVLHEKMHVKQVHSADKFVFDLLKIIFWFNPFVFWLEKSVSENHELLADEGVLENQQVNRKQYAEMLLESVWRKSMNLPVTTFFKKGGLKKRVLHILNKNPKPNKTLMKYSPLLITAVLAISFFTAACTKDSSGVADVMLDYEATVDVQPQFSSTNDSAYMDFFQKNIKYPESAKSAGIEGRVVIEFIVDKTGKILNPKVVKSSGNTDIDAEGVRLIGTMPNWEPGKKGGENVSTLFTMPISFKLKK